MWEDNARQKQSDGFDLEDIKGAAATIVIAGNDTVCSNAMISS